MSLIDVARLREIAEVEFAEIVAEAFSPDLNALRIILVDGSFVDLWFSLKLKGRYSCDAPSGLALMPMCEGAPEPTSLG